MLHYTTWQHVTILHYIILHDNTDTMPHYAMYMTLCYTTPDNNTYTMQHYTTQQYVHDVMLLHQTIHTLCYTITVTHYNIHTKPHYIMYMTP